MIPIRRFPLPAALAVMLLLGGCGKDPSPAEAPPASPSRPDARPRPASVGTPAPILPVENPKEYQRVRYRCAGGQELVLQLFDDQRTRVVIDHDTHVLRPVPVDGGTLFLGDSINVKVNGEKATASRNGIVLMANCQVQLDP